MMMSDLCSDLSDTLVIDRPRGTAFQRYMDKAVPYGCAYWRKTRDKNATEMYRRCVEARVRITSQYLSIYSMLDYGSGSGEFLSELSKVSGAKLYGYDINWYSRMRLRLAGKFFEDVGQELPFDVVTFFDSLEHLRCPEQVLRRCHGHVIISVPIINDLDKLSNFHHYRPDEHYYYWTAPGFIEFIERLGYKHIMTSDAECVAGRDSILIFVFRRV